MEPELASFFKDKPKAQPLYEAVEKKLRDTFGRMEVRVKNSQIHFRTKHTFAYVWLPTRWVRGRPSNYIILAIGLNRQIESPRFIEVNEPRKNRWVHHVMIASPNDLDYELLNWLRLAYDFSRKE